MRLVALLLLAVVVGFAVGRLTAPEAGGRGGEARATPRVAPGPDASDVGVGPSSAPPADVRAPASPDTAEDIVLPTRPVNRADEERQHLEVDFEGFRGERTAWVAERTMEGAVNAMAYEAGEAGVAIIALSPGAYEVWWLDSGGARCGTRTRIEDGMVTRLRAVDHCGPAPLPKGLGLLELHVAASWGGGLGDEFVTIRDWGDSEGQHIETDARGRIDVFYWPGRYHVEIGDHKCEVLVEEGRTTVHRIEHVHEGDLFLEADRPSYVSVLREDFSWHSPVGEPTVLAYLREGQYDIVLENMVPLGQATVIAGRATRFRCELPRGGVSVRLLKPGVEKLEHATVTIRRGTDGCETTRSVQANENPPDPVCVALPAGRYLVTAYASGCETASTEVDVGDTVVDLVIELRRG